MATSSEKSSGQARYASYPSLVDRVVFITGGASGIGASFVEHFVAQGARVGFLDIDMNAGTALAESLGPSLDAVVNNAGIAVGGPMETVSSDEWRRQLEVNVIGQLAVTRAVLPMLRKSRGRIVFISSVNGQLAMPMLGAYCASKFGFVGITKVLATEWAGRGVRVNSISPTVVLTDLGVKAWDNPKGDALKKLIPTGRISRKVAIGTCRPTYGRLRVVTVRSPP